MSSANANSTIESLSEFLSQRKARPTNHVVIGNSAGDADTIVSAVTLAYVESMKEKMAKTPVVAIPRADFANRRPEVKALFELAGIPDATDRLLFVDDSIIEHARGVKVTLVDHNVLTTTFRKQNWKVEEIVDHHRDEGQYLSSCSGDARTIAFAHDKALVASACTLVEERLKRLWKTEYPASIGVLLLGVILLDSVSLSAEAGKVTQRDKDAVQDLLEHTSWIDLPRALQNVLRITPSSGPNTTTLFDLLQDAKYDPNFWKSLSIEDALELDFKSYPYAINGSFGISTVLMPARDFFKKTNLISGILLFMTEEIHTDFLAIMFAYERKGSLRRQLALCGTAGFPLDDMVEFLLSDDYNQELLKLKAETIYPSTNTTNKDATDVALALRLFDQRNVAPSRKQIGPILLQFFESHAANPTFSTGSTVGGMAGASGQARVFHFET